MAYSARIDGLARKLAAARLDALVITHLPNIRYLCGFSGSAALLVITLRHAVVFTDGRYREQARTEIHGCQVKIGPGAPLVQAAQWLAKKASLRRVGVEAAHLTIADRNQLNKALNKHSTLVEAPPLVEQMRMVKDPSEIASIRAACRLGSKLLDLLLRKLRPGVAETLVAGELEFAARKLGADQMSFPTIIAGGQRSALPHGRASGAVLPQRGFVVCDFGVILLGYCSDMTRTLHLGRLDRMAKDGYQAVLEAQLAALESVRPGRTVGDVDSAARSSLKRRRLDKFFSHSTGHGVGLEIHEAPRVGAGATDVLQAGMVITIEPGIYLPGKWGVRIEDTVVVTETGCEILTNSRKELITL
jgi:Xaa-Pro aminopeptidase